MKIPKAKAVQVVKNYIYNIVKSTMRKTEDKLFFISTAPSIPNQKSTTVLTIVLIWALVH